MIVLKAEDFEGNTKTLEVSIFEWGEPVLLPSYASLLCRIDPFFP